MSQQPGNEWGQGEQGNPDGQGSASESGGEQWQHRDLAQGPASSSSASSPPQGQSQPDQFGAAQYGQGGADQYSQPSDNQYGQPSANQYGEWNGNQQQPAGGGQPYGQAPPPGMPHQGGMYPPQGGVPNQGYPPGGRMVGAPVSPSDEKLWGWGVHVSMLLLGFLGPLVVYLVYKDRSRWIKDNAQESLNFSILSIMVMVVGSILSFVGIGIFIVLGWYVVMLVFGIQAAVAASSGRLYKYPLNWRLVS